MLTQNCYPILKDLLSQIDNFNSYNSLVERSAKSKQIDQEIHSGRKTFQNTDLDFLEYDLEIGELLSSREQFSIKSETSQNLRVFQNNEEQVAQLA